MFYIIILSVIKQQQKTPKQTNKQKQKTKQKYNNNLIKRTLNSPTDSNICRQSGCKGNNYTSLMNIVCKNYKVASPRPSFFPFLPAREILLRDSGDKCIPL